MADARQGRSTSGSAFPELELDVAPRAPKREQPEESDEPMRIELDAPPPPPPPPPEVAPDRAVVSALDATVAAPTSGPLSGGPLPSVRVNTQLAGTPRAVAAASQGPLAVPAADDIGEEPPPVSIGAALRARAAATDPRAVARDVAEVGSRWTSGAAMIAGAIALTLLDVIYSHVTGERLGPFRLVWIAGPLVVAGGAVLAVRLLKGYSE